MTIIWKHLNEKSKKRSIICKFYSTYFNILISGGGGGSTLRKTLEIGTK